MNNKTYIKNTALLFAAMAVTKIVGAIFKIPLANVLGGTGMGYFSTAYGLYSPVFAITAAGVPTVMVRLTAQNLALGRLQNSARVKRTALVLFSLVGASGMVMIWLLAGVFSRKIACSPESAPAVIMIAPAVFFCCIGAVIRGYHEGMSNVIPSATANVIESVSRAIIGLILSYGIIGYAKYCFDNGLPVSGTHYNTYDDAYNAVLPRAAAAAIFAVTLSEICGLIILILLDRRKTKSAVLNAEPFLQRKSDIVVCIIKETIPVAGFALVLNCFSFIDLITVTRTIDTTIKNDPEYFMRAYSTLFESGIKADGIANFMYGSYTGIAMSLFMLIPSFAGMTEKTAIPEIAAAWERKDLPTLERKICILMKTTALIGFPACFGAAAIAEPILKLLYPSRAAEVLACKNGFIVLCLCGMFLISTSVLSSVFQAIGKSYIPIFTTVTAVAIKAILNPLLIGIPQLNVTGAAFATVAAYLVSMTISLIILNKYLRVTKLLKEYVLPLICAAFCAATAVSISTVLTGVNTLIVVVSAVSGAIIVYVLLLIITGAFRTTPIRKHQNRKKSGKGLAKSQKIG